MFIIDYYDCGYVATGSGGSTSTQVQNSSALVSSTEREVAVEGDGMTSPWFRISSRCISIASPIICRACSMSAAVATQPGRSGTLTLYPVRVRRMKTKYRITSLPAANPEPAAYAGGFDCRCALKRSTSELSDGIIAAYCSSNSRS